MTSTVTTKAIAKVAAVATGLAFAVSMLSLAPIAHAAALTDSQVSAILSLLTSFGADSATIANVQASLTGGTPSTPSTPSSSSCSFTRSLTTGATGSDVTCLQQALIAAGYSIPAGATGYFGGQTVAAVSAWQKAAGVSPAAGYFGPISRSAFNLGGGSSTTGGTPSTPITGNGLKIALASDSPNNIALVQGQATGDLAHFTFSNPTSSDVKVTNLSFNRIGVSTDSALSNVYLFEGAVRITDPAGISNSTFNFNDSTGIFTVPAGSSKTIQVRADIAGSTSGQQIGAQLTAVSGATLDSSVSLPINGYTQTVSSASIATVVFGTVTIPAGNSSLPPGNDTTVFQSTVTVGTRAALLKSITLENRGSTLNEDLQNIKLYVKGVQVGATVAQTANKKVTFDFSSNPLRLETGGNDFRVAADVIGGSGETIDFQLRRAVDGQFIDSNLNQPILVTGDFSGTADTVEGVDLSVTKASNSPSSNVALDATNVKWASFEFRAIGDDLKVEQITVDVDENSSSLFTDLDNGKVFLNGVQIGSTQDILEAGTTVFAFGSQMILKKGTVAIVDIYSDAKNADGTSMTTAAQLDVGVSVATADTEGVKSGDRLGTAISEVEGNNITVSSASLSASKITSYSDQSVVSGTNDFKLGSFTLAAGANEGVNVNTIAIGFASAEASTLANLRLVNASTGAAIGSTKSSVGTTNTFSVTGVSVPASGSIAINVLADVKSSANIGAISATTVKTTTGGTGTATGNSISVSNAATLQTMTVVGTGTLTAAVNTGGTPADALVVGGTSGVKVGSFNFLATNAGQTINKVLVKVPSNSASAVATITLKDGSTTLKAQGFDLGSPGASPYATSTFTSLGFAVPAGQSKTLDVYVDLVAIDANNSALTGEAISVLLDGDEGFEATDGAGNLDTTLTGSTADLSSDGTGVGVMYIRKAVPTLSSTPVESTLANGANQVIGKFAVTASNSGNGIDWGHIMFTMTKTSGLTVGATTTVKLYDVTGGAHNVVAGTFATTTGTAGVGTMEMFATTATSGTIEFRPTNVESISAGASKSYQLESTIGGITTGTNSLSITLAATATAIATNNYTTIASTLGGATDTFIWSDWSDVADHFASATASGVTDWTDDYLVKPLPLTIGNRQVSSQ